MSEYVGDRLPAKLQAAFNGQDIEQKIGLAYLVVTTDPDGTPRPCMLSAGEILVLDDQTMRVALWPRTHTADNLRRQSPVAICFVAPNTVLYVKGRPRQLGPSGTTDIEGFEIKVDSVESDIHEGLPVTQGISFSCQKADRGALLHTWNKKLRALKES